LRRRGRLDARGDDESQYLAPLEAIVDEGRTLAQRRLDAYYGPWGESIDAAFTECAMPI
jgi:glutamate--cysteine ligase